MTQYWGGGHKTHFLLILYNLKNIGGGGMCPPSPYSAVPASDSHSVLKAPAQFSVWYFGE